MRIAMSQPTYLPWLGYLDLIDQVDTFVFLDSVQFEKRSWQQRNRIKVQGGLQLLTVPVAVKGRFEQKIKDVEIESLHFVQKHLRSIVWNYRRAPFFRRYFEEFAAILKTCKPGIKLADLNIQLIQWLCAAFGIRTPLRRSSGLDEGGFRAERLLKICCVLGASTYLSSPGSAEYLADALPQFSRAGVDVIFQNYHHPSYAQMSEPFAAQASAIDLLFNHGDQSLEILRSGRGPALSPSALPGLRMGEACA